MKTTKLVVAGILTMNLAFSSINASQLHNVTVSVDFGNPSGFTDIEVNSFPGDKRQSIIFDLLRGEFEINAGSYLRCGYTLNV